MEKYDSLFSFEKDIDISNYITELLIKHRLEWLKKPLPKCAFWRKEYYTQSKELESLSKIYQLELIGVKQLLKVFNQHILIGYIMKSRCVGFKSLKKENQNKIIIDLYHAQSTYKNTNIPTQKNNNLSFEQITTNSKSLIGLLQDE
jgi:hypothetical protein